MTYSITLWISKTGETNYSQKKTILDEQLKYKCLPCSHLRLDENFIVFVTICNIAIAI